MELPRLPQGAAAAVYRGGPERRDDAGNVNKVSASLTSRQRLFSRRGCLTSEVLSVENGIQERGGLPDLPPAVRPTLLRCPPCRPELCQNPDPEEPEVVPEPSNF